MQILFIVNDSPYSSDKSYNGVRTAVQIQKEDPTVKALIFLIVAQNEPDFAKGIENGSLESLELIHHTARILWK